MIWAYMEELITEDYIRGLKLIWLLDIEIGGNIT